MKIVKCANRKCGLICPESERREKKNADGWIHLHCPRCDEESYYDAKPGETEKPKSGAQLIALERERQIKIEGWSSGHDDDHDGFELSSAARCYAQPGITSKWPAPAKFPWEEKWWKPSDDPIRNLVKAGALIAAEIDRLQRTTSVQNAPHKPSGANA